ncbi:nucleoside-diphosphate kinase [Paraburkholderia tropica]|uniref:nucleoside-diphosphate kinase n=1 Tax=Paraburkholderia tropica TaxID=92647 RepID=UPI002AB67721|nr:nucleoside-diphosphate kinase [Paraburkholderia tropica]
MTNISISIITPDAIVGGLTRNILSSLEKTIGGPPIDGYWSKIGRDDCRKLYPDLEDEKLDLIARLFEEGPCWVSLWSADAQSKLEMLKGSTHPANARVGSIRSMFLSDNPVTNLIHVSDSTNIAAIEEKIFKGGVKLDVQEIRYERYVSSGIISFVFFIKEKFGVDLFCGRESEAIFNFGMRKTHEFLSNEIVQYSQRNCELGELANHFLSGSAEKVNEILDSFDISKISRISIESYLRSRSNWDRGSLDKVIGDLVVELRQSRIQGWRIGGSAALWWHGISTNPSDIDIRCPPEVLDALSEFMGVSIFLERTQNYTSRCFSIMRDGWEIEFSDSLCFDDGSILHVNRGLLNNPVPEVESIDNLIAEYVAMDRGEPFRDKANVVKLRELKRSVR